MGTKRLQASTAHNSKRSEREQRIASPLPLNKRLYDLKEAATYLGRPVWGIRELVWAGKLPAVRDGRKQYVDLRDMDRYIEQNKVRVV